MTKSFHTKTFKSGNSVAVRLPKGFHVPEGVEVELTREGSEIRLKPLVDPEDGKRRLRELFDKLNALPPVGEVEKRIPIEFPDRPGLY